MNLPNELPANADELTAQAREIAGKVGDHLSEHAAHLRDTASTVRYNSEEFIQNNPWPAIGIAAAVGFVFGVMVARH